MLSMALYRTFTHHDPATTALRYAVYDMWRRSARERERTMNLLAAEETGIGQFGAAFLHAAGLAAVRQVLGHSGTTTTRTGKPRTQPACCAVRAGGCPGLPRPRAIPPSATALGLRGW